MIVTFRTSILVVILTLCSLPFHRSEARAQQPLFEKLPISINQPDQDDALPVITSDGNTLYFTRTRAGMDNSTVFDIWRTHLLGDTGFSPAEFLGGTLSSSHGIAVISSAPDNNTLYLIGNPSGDAPPDERVFVTHKLMNGWSIPEAIHIPNLRVRGSSTDYTFGPDQKTLLMAVNRDSTLGDRDLYVSFFDEHSNAWSAPLWLGAAINSEYTEMTPFLAGDNKTLYFSSNRAGGLGQVDVYCSHRLDDSWQRWSKPENLGPKVNRPGRTSYYTEDVAGKYAYIAWRAGLTDHCDLYRIRVEHTQAVAFVHGRVTDAEGHPLASRVRYSRLDNGASIGTARSDPQTGEYHLDLPGGVEYAVNAEKDGYFPTSDHLDLRALAAFESIGRDLKLTKIKAGSAVVLKNVFFETDKSILLPASFTELDRVKDLLASQPNYKLQIAGHTDSTGVEAHNIALGQARAEAVRNYLLSKGTAPERLSATSFGSSTPVASNKTEEGRAENRRVEFTLQ